MRSKEYWINPAGFYREKSKMALYWIIPNGHIIDSLLKLHFWNDDIDLKWITRRRFNIQNHLNIGDFSPWLYRRRLDVESTYLLKSLLVVTLRSDFILRFDDIFCSSNLL